MPKGKVQTQKQGSTAVPQGSAKKTQKGNKKEEAPYVPIKAASKNISKDNGKASRGSGSSDDGPKKPATAYSIFLKQMNAQMKNMPKFNSLTIGERAKVISESWAKLTEDQKQQYVEMANADKERYKREVKAKEGQKGKKSAPPIKEDKGVQPKRPMAAFFQFANQNRPKLMKENPDKKITEIAKLIGQQWAKLTEEEKKPFEKLHGEDILRHQREMKQLQEKGFFINSDGIKSTELDKKGKVGSYFPTGTVMPKKADHPYLCFSKEYYKENTTTGTSAPETIKKIAAKWREMTDKHKKKYEVLSQKEHVRYDDQLAQLKKNGYFMTEDGKKSSDLPYKAPKQRRAKK